jgi:hypothetical protein
MMTDNETGYINVVGFQEHEDGSATYQVDLSPDMVLAFAKIGLEHSVKEGVKLFMEQMEKESE